MADFDKHIETLEDIFFNEDFPSNNLDLSAEAEWSIPALDAAEVACDSLAFCQSLWNLLKEQGLVTDSEAPDFKVMEKVIDSLYGELFAVTMMLSQDQFGMDKHIDGFIALLENTSNALKNKASNDEVPAEVINGFRAFAARLRNAKKQRVQLIATQKPS